MSKTDSGYVTKIQAGNVIMSGTEFAKILGLSSAAMTIENSNGKIKITTKGLGDGMGVSFIPQILWQNKAVLTSRF